PGGSPLRRAPRGKSRPALPSPPARTAARDRAAARRSWHGPEKVHPALEVVGDDGPFQPVAARVEHAGQDRGPDVLGTPHTPAGPPSASFRPISPVGSACSVSIQFCAAFTPRDGQTSVSR